MTPRFFRSREFSQPVPTAPRGGVTVSQSFLVTGVKRIPINATQSAKSPCKNSPISLFWVQEPFPTPRQGTPAVPGLDDVLGLSVPHGSLCKLINTSNLPGGNGGGSSRSDPRFPSGRLHFYVKINK